MINKETIIYIGGFELPDKNAAAHRVLSNGKIFRELGYNVVFIGVDKSLNNASNILDTRRKVQGFETWSVPYPKGITDWLKYLSGIKDFKVIFEQYDVSMVIAYNYQALALNKLRKFCISHKCKIIADCTEWYSTKGSGLIFKIIKGTDSFMRMRVIHKKLNGLIVISNYLNEYYNQLSATVILPPLVDLDEEKWMLNTDNNNDKIRLVYSGTPGREKDKINYLIDILYELRNQNNLQLKIVGISRDEFLENFPEYTSKVISLFDQLDFHGRVSHLESLSILKEADVSMFIREDNQTTKAGFPTKFVESISAGVPVITTPSSDLIDYLVVGDDGYFIDSISSKETKIILKDILITNPKKIKNLKKHKLVNREKFNYKNYKDSVRTFINTLS